MATNASHSNLDLANKLDAWAKRLTDAAKSIRKADDASFDHRLTASATAQDILQTVQQPIEHLMSSLVLLVQFTATRLFVKWKAFEKIPLQGSISYKELSEKIQADEALVSRFAISIQVIPANPLTRTLCLDIGWHWNSAPTGARPSRAHGCFQGVRLCQPAYGCPEHGVSINTTCRPERF